MLDWETATDPEVEKQHNKIVDFQQLKKKHLYLNHHTPNDDWLKFYRPRCQKAPMPVFRQLGLKICTWKKNSAKIISNSADFKNTR